MKVIYDAETDVLRIVLNDVPIEESNEDASGVILDYDEVGNVVGFEVLSASTRVKKSAIAGTRCYRLSTITESFVDELTRKMPILDPDRSYSFSQIFELNVSPVDLIPEFGYHFSRAFLDFSITETPDVTSLVEEFTEVLPYVDLTNEQARRETLVSSIVKFVVRKIQARLSYEYAVKTAKLYGTVDYLLQKPPFLVIIEAKRDDLGNGFNQLASQLVALNQWEDAPPFNVQPTLLGAITTGTFWQFALLHRQTQHIVQDLQGYRVPADLGVIVQIILQALQPFQTLPQTHLVP